ncbi:MAG TPA: hypothetical protein VFI18_11325 [Gaiellales bacterium]|nr:hypothetical protein [Gaiellales bacterium]
MSQRMRTAAALATVSLAAACSSGGAASSHRVTTPGLDGCVHAGPGVRIVAAPSAPGPIRVAVLGTGATAAVFTNESDLDLCSWLPFARSLARNGVRALLYDYRYTTQHDALTVAREARRLGAKRVVLVGASVGARGSLAAAAGAPRGLVDAVVSLSAERVTREGVPDLFPVVRHLRAPTLYVAARNDPYATGTDAPQLYRRTAATRKRLVLVPGTAHGVKLLEGAAGARVRGIVTAFIR